MSAGDGFSKRDAGEEDGGAISRQSTFKPSRRLSMIIQGGEMLEKELVKVERRGRSAISAFAGSTVELPRSAPIAERHS